MALDSIAKALNLTWSQKPTWKSDITETTIRIESLETVKEYQITMLKPRKLMNISGSCVAQAGKKKKKKKKAQTCQNINIFHSQRSFDTIKEFICIS